MTKFLIPCEEALGESRVSATPETVKKLKTLGCEIFIEKSAGELSGFNDFSYEKNGGIIFTKNDNNAWETADIIFCINCPDEERLKKLKKGALIIGLLNPFGNKPLAQHLFDQNLSAISLELLPRISRAQSCDVLSSQANIAGYKSVLLAASELDRYFPMLMTAAGTVQPAKVVVLGGGVAGLQAVATAKRLGALVFVSDIRPAVKEQVESLGAKFIRLPEIEEKPSESGGYAKAVSSKFLEEQRQILSEHLSEADVAICTAQVLGKKAPILINEKMLQKMRPGSVVVDLAVSQGGNCVNTEPNKTIIYNGVKLIGAPDLPASVPFHASSLYARNLNSLIAPFIKEGNLALDKNDEIIQGCLISDKGAILQEKVFEIGGGN